MKKLVKVLTAFEVIASMLLLAGSIAGMVFFFQGVDVFAGLAELVNDFLSLGGTGSELVAADFVFILFCSLAVLITLSLATLSLHVRVSHKREKAPRAPKAPRVKKVREKRVKVKKVIVKEETKKEAPVTKPTTTQTAGEATTTVAAKGSFVDKLKRK